MLRSEDEQARAWLRRILVPEVLYEGMPRSGTDEHYDGDTHVTTLTFMAGYHFGQDAKSWADLQKPARAVLAPILNGYKHLAPNGKQLHSRQVPADGPSLRLASVPLKWHTDVAVEVIPSAANAEGKVFCAGYRVHFIGHEQGGGAAAVVDEPPADAPGGRGRAAASRAQQRGSEMAKALEKLKQEARHAPLAVALAKSFAEAAFLRDLIPKKREDYVKNNKTQLGELVAREKARTHIKEGRQVPEYAFEEFASMDDFLYGAIQPYFRTRVACPRAHPTHDPGNGFLDFYEGCSDLETANDEIKAATRHKLLSNEDYYVHPTSPVHPDHIFCLARSMAYFMRDGDYAASRACTQLDQYIPGAIGRPGAPVAAAPPAPPAQDPQTDSVESDDDEDDDDDDDDDDDVEDIPPRRTNAPDPMDVDLRGFIRGTDGLFEPYNHVVARGTWPFPGLVFKVNPIAAYAETFLSILPLPYAIGAELPARALQHREQGGTAFLPEMSTIHVTTALKAAERLHRGEEAAAQMAAAAAAAEEETVEADENAAPFAFSLNRRALPAKMKAMVMVRGRDGTMRRQAVSDVEVLDAPDPTQNAGQALDRQLEAEEAERQARHLAPEEEFQQLKENGANGIPERYKADYEHHKAVVRRAVNALAGRFKHMAYGELYVAIWEQRLDPLPSHAVMPPGDFYEPRASGDDDDAALGLPRLRKLLAIEQPRTGFTAADDRIVLDSVELHPAWLLEREEPIVLRQEFQLAKATLAHKSAKERDALILDPKFEKDPQGLRLAQLELAEKHAKAVDQQKQAMYARGHAVYFETDRLAPALKAMRDYTRQQVLPNRDKPHLKKPVSVSVRGFVAFRQFYMDTYRSAELATKANCPFTERVHTCAYHAFRWMAKRTDPALNYTMTGESGAGKSKALLTTISLFPPAIVSDVASETTNSYNVDQNFDGYIVIYQEMPNDLLFSDRGGSGKGKDQGPSDKTNFAKARLTSFHTHTRFFKFNEQTSKREASISNSSQHIVTMGATNQDLTKMDKNMRRRLMIDIFAEAPTESEGSNPADMVRPQSESPEAYKVQDHASAEHRELAAAYALVENYIKMGIIDDVLTNRAGDFLNHILEQAAPVIGSAARNKGYKVWVLEAARVLTIQHAVYETLFGAKAHALYEAGKYKRWSHQAFQYICEPHLAVFKDAVIHALTMLDFLYSSQTEDLLLRTIALHLLHVDEPHRWRFRVKGDLSLDYNYLAFTGASVPKIHKAIVDKHSVVNVMRAEDVPTLLRKHLTKKSSSLGFEGVELDAAGLPTKLVKAQEGGGRVLEERAMFLYEDDPESKAVKAKPLQFCMSIEFIQNLFAIDLTKDTPEQVRARIERKEHRIDAAKLRAADPQEAVAELRQIMKCTEGRAPLVAAIRKALRMPTLEKSPYEHPDYHQVPQELYSYPTFYLPEDIYIRWGEAMEKRVPVDGTAMSIDGERDPNGAYIMQANYTKPLATARSTLYGIHPGRGKKSNARTSSLPEMSRGFICDLYDIDYFSAVAALERQGHPGEPLMLELFTNALVHFRDTQKHPNEKEFRRRLLRDIPELDPTGGVPLPFAFPPIAYMIDLYLARVKHAWEDEPHYPATGILERLQDALEMADAKSNKNENGAFQKLSAQHHCDDRRFYMEHKIKRAREAALAGPHPQEEEERPEKRARLEPILEEPEEEDAMDIDGPDGYVPAAAALQRFMPARPPSPGLFEEEEEDMFTD
jgi:hypothetical protein